VLQAGRALGAAAVVFHAVVAQKQGLQPTEEKALDFLDRFGPLTAGELGTRSGLAPASVTGLLDRLERKGFVRRVADPADGRRVRAELVPERVQALAPLFVDLVAELETLCHRYSVEELQTVARFMAEAAERQRAAAARLSAGQPPDTSRARPPG
jgi:DNA-binding MarR family transcriptional regulator